MVDARYIENRPVARTGACRKSRLGVFHPRCTKFGTAVMVPRVIVIYYVYYKVPLNLTFII